MKRKTIAVLLGLALGAFALTPTMAQTPDGQTPANEGICDDLRADGITKGLYGLCVAFCEAQDHADVTAPITDAELEALALAAPSGRILANYNKKKTETDPPMPCIVVEEPCPCWTSAELAEIDGFMWDGTAANSPSPVETNGRRCFDSTTPLVINTFSYEIDRASEPDRETLAQSLFFDFGTPFNLCQFRRRNDATNTFFIRNIVITPEEREACTASLRDFQANSGFCETIQP
jgi:hypothetical protein